MAVKQMAMALLALAMLGPGTPVLALDVEENAAQETAAPDAAAPAPNASAATLTPEAQASEPKAPQSEAPQANTEASPAAEKPASETAVAPAPAPAAAPLSAAAAALKARLAANVLSETASDEEKKEAAATDAFYAAASYAPLWIGDNALNARAKAVMAEIANAKSYALEPADFPVPSDAAQAAGLAPDAAADAELTLTRAVLTYARYARGGRIISPTDLLTTQIDRRPQLLDPKRVLDEIAAAAEPGVYLAGTNPRHVQFERLRARYTALLEAAEQRLAKPGKSGAKPMKSGARDAEMQRLRANMEMWRWMPDDLGETYMMANVPEFMIRLVKNGEVLHTERVVAGRIDKQTAIFSRPLKEIVFRPMWRVPESIKVRELWPSLLRGGGLMRSYGLELQTKDGTPLDYRKIDWKTADIREYEVVQPPSPRNALGVVKFAFPSQHTIFMHDTPDKWMFNSSQRTHSHGCLRLRNPVRMAELVLAEDKGWDAAKIADLIAAGPMNNKVQIDKKIRMHIVYFTAWVDDSGKLLTYRDVYGHEKRVKYALEGRWSAIDKGKDHLAPIDVNRAVTLAEQAPAPKNTMGSAFTDFMSAFLGAASP